MFGKSTKRIYCLAESSDTIENLYGRKKEPQPLKKKKQRFLFWLDGIDFFIHFNKQAHSQTCISFLRKNHQ